MLKPSRLTAGLRRYGSLAAAPRADAAPSASAPFSAPAFSQPIDRTPLHFVPPTPREVRAQAVQRLQVGILGLATMLLLIGLANIIMQHARQSDIAQAPAGMVHQASSGGAGGSDPLADIGVAPAPDTAAAQRRAAAHPTGH